MNISTQRAKLIIVIFAQQVFGVCVNFIRHAWRFCVRMFWRNCANVAAWRIEGNNFDALLKCDAAATRNARALRPQSEGGLACMT